MNAGSVLNSIYNPKKHDKDNLFLPKIIKPQQTPTQNRIIGCPPPRKYNQQNMFKIQDEKKPKIQLRIDQQNIRDLRKRETEEMENKMAQFTKRHQTQLLQIEKKQKEILDAIQEQKRIQYQTKLDMWGLKNDLIQLNSLFLEEDALNKKLQAELGQRGEYQQENQEYEQGNEEYEGGNEEYEEGNQEGGLEQYNQQQLSMEEDKRGNDSDEMIEVGNLVKYVIGGSESAKSFQNGELKNQIEFE